MNYSQITAFISLAESGTMTGAAESLFVTQSTLSNRIASLEAELGAQLAVRGKGIRNVTLTQEGQKFLDFAYKWKQLYDETLEAVSSGTAGALALGSGGSLSKYLIQEVLENYSVKNPGSTMRFMIMNSPESYEYVRNKDVEAAFIANPRFTKHMINVPLFREKMLFVCHSGNDYPASVHPSDLDPEKEILLDWHREFTQWHDYWFGRTCRTWTNDMNTLDTFLEHESSWAVVPLSAALHLTENKHLVMREIKKGPAPRTAYMIRNRHEEMSDALSVFLGLLKERTSALGIEWLR